MQLFYNMSQYKVVLNFILKVSLEYIMSGFPSNLTSSYK